MHFMEDSGGVERACCKGHPLETAEVVVPRDRIEQRLGELAEEITRACPGGELTVVGVMNGALLFLADLVRRLPLRVEITTLRARSYRGASTAPGAVELAGDIQDDLTGREVLVVDDVLDTGATLSAVLEAVRARRPASCRVCVLLRKPDRPGRDLRTDFVGFDIPDQFVVGYGLDYDGRGRSLPDIMALANRGGGGS